MKTPSLSSLTAGKLRAALVCFAIMFGLSTAAVSGATLTFAVGTTNGVTNSQVIVPVRVSHFTDISSFQFSFTGTQTWRPSLESNSSTCRTVGTDFGVFPTGTVTVAWVEPNASSTNLADGSTVFSVNFNSLADRRLRPGHH